MIPKKERDAQVKLATPDQSDIRGLATAFHHFFAGLPSSRNGDHPRKSGSGWNSAQIVEDPSHRSRAWRFRFCIWLDIGLSPAVFGRKIPSGSPHLARRIQLRDPRYGRQTIPSKRTHDLIPIAGSGHDVI